MAKHWRKRMEEAKLAIPSGWKVGEVSIEVSDEQTATIKHEAADPSDETSIDMSDMQNLADWLRKSYGIVGRAK